MVPGTLAAAGVGSWASGGGWKGPAKRARVMKGCISACRGVHRVQGSGSCSQHSISRPGVLLIQSCVAQRAPTTQVAQGIQRPLGVPNFEKLPEC